MDSAAKSVDARTIGEVLAVLVEQQGHQARGTS
jgi:hypothetical protein